MLCIKKQRNNTKGPCKVLHKAPRDCRCSPGAHKNLIDSFPTAILNECCYCTAVHAAAIKL